MSAQELQIEHVPVAQIDPNPWNPNKQTDLIAKATRESLEHFGFVEPIAVRRHPDDPERFQVINGEHRLKEGTELGHETVPVVVLDVTEEEAKKLTIVLNETTGDADVVLLAKLLAELHAHDEETFRVALPYTDSELDHLLALAQENWDNFPTGNGDGDPPDPALANFEEFVVMVPRDQADDFRTWIEMGKRNRDLDDFNAVVVAAVRDFALRSHRGDPLVDEEEPATV